ncbi:MAG: hypothetical protein LBM16_01520 [Clostridiales bacterium]|jgi:transcriptional regulator of heat shock response|nr:hypothetical protein [Clostridiales bacterium]
MENIIQELIRIDSDAQSVVAEAEKLKSGLAERLETCRNELQSQMETDVKSRIRHEKESAEKETAEKTAEFLQEKQRKIAALEAEYEQNKDVWATRIFSSITGR